MSPRALLFSSEEETSRRVTRALEELELEVDVCTEIFHAVEKLTSSKFEVVVADFQVGLEASFLLKTARELKSSGGPCLAAITRDEDSVVAARRLGAIILAKPVVIEQAKYLLLNSDEFLQRMSTWLPQVVPFRRSPEAAAAPTSTSPGVAVADPELCRVDSPELLSVQRLRQQSSFSRNDYVRDSHIQSIFQTSRSRPASNRKEKSRRSIVCLAVLVVFFLLSVGYIFSEPLRTEAFRASVARICTQAVKNSRTWLHRSSSGRKQEETESTESAGLTIEALPIIHVAPPRKPTGSSMTWPQQPQPRAPAIGGSAEPQPLQASGLQIPDSLHAPLQIAAVPGVEPKVSSALLGPVEPVEIPEQVSRQLLLQKIAPPYPEQARKTGLQGPVILQARIGRDGKIENLKLVDGYLVLGQAAYQAVRQWQFKPYVVNGHPVAMQTYITVNFQLPTYSSLTPENSPPKEGSR